MRTSKDYLKALQKMKTNVYMDGKKVPRDHEVFFPGIKLISLTYDLAADPEWSELLTATSHISGKKINRFCHIHQSQEDLLKRREMTGKFQRHTGACIQRCGGADTINALSIVTHDIDQEYKTEYNKRFLKYLHYFQDNDLIAPITMTDVKGDRSKRPREQTDPDMYLRIVEKKPDGIVVRGAKNCNTFASYGDELIISPSRALTKEESDWAVAFAIPADWEGVKLVCSPMPVARKRKHMPAVYAEYGIADSFTIFDNVFVPWDRVFMCGEVKYAPIYGYLAAIFHRFNYTACKPAMADIFIGAAALAAEYNGVERHEHVREKLAHLIASAVLIDAAGLAASLQSRKTASGTWVPGGIPTHAGRWLAGTNAYKEFEILTDLAGGLGSCLPHEGDFFNEEVGPLLNKYIKRKDDVPAEHIHKLWRFINDITASPFTGINQAASLHGGGSPIMEMIGMVGEYDIQGKKNLVKRLCGITPPDVDTK
jgi:4-hydroxyphenylacetate 3-monooxygenase/4-hydroxybutyryl-CoA dehydratase/vinylacetyl-CoA-Delta-isomerase